VEELGLHDRRLVLSPPDDTTFRMPRQRRACCAGPQSFLGRHLDLCGLQFRWSLRSHLASMSSSAVNRMRGARAVVRNTEVVSSMGVRAVAPAEPGAGLN